jgi:hypothetical protein
VTGAAASIPDKRRNSARPRSDGPNNPYLNITLAATYSGKPHEAITREQAVVASTLTLGIR